MGETLSDQPTASYSAGGPEETVPPPARPLCCPHCGELISRNSDGPHERVCRGCGSSFRVENVLQPNAMR